MKFFENNKILCCILNYKHDENAMRLYDLFSPYCETYLIDTFHLDNGTVFENESENIVYLHNVYWGGSQIKAYQLLCESGREYLLTIDSDIEIDDENAEKMLSALKYVYQYDNIGVYSGTLKLGSKALGSKEIYLINCYLFNQKTNQLRNIHRNEGWLNCFKKEVLDDIMPFLSVEENKYGWGISNALCRRAIKRGLRVVGDDRYEVFHPADISYDNKEAVVEELKFKLRWRELGCILNEENNLSLKDIKQ